MSVYINNMVSVIITTYNRRRFVRGAALSVLKQDYPDKEVIVVDDGSVDGSFEELNGLQVRYVWKPNAGISSARNAGIRVARGEYIAFLDVDDLWQKGKLSAQIERMKREGHVVSYTNEIWVRNGKRMNQKNRHRKYSGDIFGRCLPLCIISPSSAVIRRDIFGDVGMFDESMPVCEDYDMWLRITSGYPVLFIDEPFIVKTGGHDDQLSTRYEAMDRFRIGSIARLIESGRLNEGQLSLALEMLKEKTAIYAEGAKKRGRTEEAQYFLSIYGKLSGRIFPSGLDTDMQDNYTTALNIKGNKVEHAV